MIVDLSKEEITIIINSIITSQDYYGEENIDNILIKKLEQLYESK